MFRGYKEMSMSAKFNWAFTLVSLIKHDEEINRMLKEDGFTDEEADNLDLLVNKAFEIYSNQNTSDVEKKQSYKTYYKSFKDLEADYNNVMEYARVSFKRLPEKAVALQIDASKVTRQSDLLKRIAVFCDISLKDEEILQILAKRRFTKEKIEAIKAKLKKTNEYLLASIAESREYHYLVEGKNISMEKMEEALEDTVDLLRVTFKNRSDILKKLEI